MSLWQALDGLLQPRGLHLAHYLSRCVGGALVFDEVAELRRALVRAQRLVEADRVSYRALDIAYLLYGPPELLSDLLVGSIASQPGRELVVSAGHLAHLVTHVYGDTDGAALVSNCPLYRLTDPPRSIRGEPKAPLWVELLYCFHQPYVSLLDQILEGKAVSTVLLGHRDYKPQVLLNEALAGLLVACLGALREVYLFCVREQISLADVRQVLGQQLWGLGFPLRLRDVGPLL